MSAENGWIFDLKRFAVHDGPGIRSTAFLQGCPLHCPWCHNPESIPIPRRDHPAPQGAQWIDVPELVARLERDRVFFEESGGGVTFSGGEPLSQPHFLEALLRECRQRGLHSAVDTCGHAPTDTAVPLLRLADLVLYDIKLFSSSDLHRTCGVGAGWISDNLSALVAAQSRLWLRFPLIPEYTDTPGNLDALLDLVRHCADGIERISILPFHPAAAHKYHRLGIPNPMQGVPMLPEKAAQKLLDRLKAIHPEVHIGG